MDRTIFNHVTGSENMLCAQCQKRDARVHITQIADGEMTNLDLCPQCAREREASLGLEGQHGGFFDDMCSEHPRYQMEAYQFVQQGLMLMYQESCGDLPHAIEGVSDPEKLKKVVEARDLPLVPSPQQAASRLLDILQQLALEQFGMQAKAVLNGWGIMRCEDFGEIALRMSGGPIFGWSPDERTKAFQGGYDFEKAFPSS